MLAMNRTGDTATRAEHAQQAHYDRIAEQYEAHYNDEHTRRYREHFIDPILLDGLDLRGRKVLEALCGSGMTTEALLKRGASVTGLDISDASIASFRHKWPDCEAVRRSILDSGLPDGSFSAVVIVSGLHHLHPHVEEAVREVHRLLEPGGTFCFFEPHLGSFPDWFRQRWYERDPLFVENEAAVDVDALKEAFSDRFAFIRETYGGNLAFLLVVNSLVFRIRQSWKRFYSSPLLWLESRIGALQGKRTSCFVICQWRKK